MGFPLSSHAAGKEGLSQGLKPVLWLCLYVRTKVLTYLRDNSKCPRGRCYCLWRTWQHSVRG